MPAVLLAMASEVLVRERYDLVYNGGVSYGRP